MEELIEQYRLGQISRTELEKQLQAHWNNMQAADPQFSNYRKEEMWRIIMQHQPATEETKVTRFGWIKYAAAAVILFAIAGTYFLLNKKEPVQSIAHAYKNDVQPGRTGAILELPNGKRIVLDTASNGLIASQNNASFTKNQTGISIANTGKDEPIEFVKVIVPLKHTQMISLPDGSQIWLNAGSSMVFPTRFTGNERRVKTTGEVIAKVKVNASNPFRIETRGQIFEDKGTEFDINAYDDEAVIKTTVLEGIVETQHKQIKAGQQAASKGNDVTVTAITEDKIDEIFAWRDEQFNYAAASVEDILKQAAKWYDVEVVFENRINEKFTISVDRKKPISNLLHAMELSGGVHFEIDGRKIIVKK